MSKTLLFLVANDRYFCTHRLPLAVEAKQKGYDVVVVAPALGDHASILQAGLTFDPISFDRRSLSPIIACKTFLQIVQKYQQHKPHIVHHVALKPVILGTLAAKICRVPKIVNAISGLGHIFSRKSFLRHVMRFLFRIVLKNTDVIVQNPEDENEVKPYTTSLHLLLGAGVDIKRFTPLPAPITPPYIITHVSRLLWTKGVKELVEAARLLRKTYPIRVQIVGMPDNENPESIPESVLEEWHQAGDICWLKKRDDIETIYQETHVAVLASYYREGIPKSLLEAAACGKPIVTCDQPGCNIVVQNNLNGYLIPPQDVMALVKALEKLILSPDLCKKMGHESRQLALKLFSCERIHAQTFEVYNFS